jgi:hypothetical protein
MNRARRALRIRISINALPVAKHTLAPALKVIFIAASTFYVFRICSRISSASSRSPAFSAAGARISRIFTYVV